MPTRSEVNTTITALITASGSDKVTATDHRAANTAILDYVDQEILTVEELISSGGGEIIIDSTPTDGSTNAVSSNGVFDALAGKAATSHTHAISEVTGLQTALDGKQASGSYAVASHTHAATDVTEDTTHRFVTDTEKTSWNAKQAALVSATNIKTINGTSLLGSGDISISGGGGGGGIDGTGTANKVAMFSDADTVANAPITVSGNNITVAGQGSFNSALHITSGGNGEYYGAGTDDYASFGSFGGAAGMYIATGLKASLGQGQNYLKTTSDPGHAIRMSYNEGIAFHMNYTGGTGVQVSATANEVMRILPNGNVGVGKASPGYKLDINGGLRVDGVISAAALGDYADDSAAATGGVLVGEFYRTGSIVKQRIA